MTAVDNTEWPEKLGQLIVCHIYEYTKKLALGKATSDKVMYSLCWIVDELGQLNKQRHELYLEVTSLLQLLHDDMTDMYRIQHCLESVMGI